MKQITEKKGLGMMELLTGFVIVAAILILIVMLIFVFGSITIGLESTAVSNSVTNESDNSGEVVMLNNSGYTLRETSSTGNPRTYAISQVLGNMTDGIFYVIPSTNYSVTSAGVLRNATIIPNQTQYDNVSVSYTYVNNSASQTAASDAQTNTTRAIPLIGILFIILAVATIITLLIVSLLGRKKA